MVDRIRQHQSCFYQQIPIQNFNIRGQLGYQSHVFQQAQVNAPQVIPQSKCNINNQKQNIQFHPQQAQQKQSIIQQAPPESQRKINHQKQDSSSNIVVPDKNMKYRQYSDIQYQNKENIQLESNLLLNNNQNKLKQNQQQKVLQNDSLIFNQQMIQQKKAQQSNNIKQQQQTQQQAQQIQNQQSHQGYQSQNKPQVQQQVPSVQQLQQNQQATPRQQASKMLEQNKPAQNLQSNNQHQKHLRKPIFSDQLNKPITLQSNQQQSVTNQDQLITQNKDQFSNTPHSQRKSIFDQIKGQNIASITPDKSSKYQQSISPRLSLQCQTNMPENKLGQNNQNHSQKYSFKEQENNSKSSNKQYIFEKQNCAFEKNGYQMSFCNPNAFENHQPSNYLNLQVDQNADYDHYKSNSISPIFTFASTGSFASFTDDILIQSRAMENKGNLITKDTYTPKQINRNSQINLIKIENRDDCNLDFCKQFQVEDQQQYSPQFPKPVEGELEQKNIEIVTFQNINIDEEIIDKFSDDESIDLLTNNQDPYYTDLIPLTSFPNPNQMMKEDILQQQQCKLQSQFQIEAIPLYDKIQIEGLQQQNYTMPILVQIKQKQQNQNIQTLSNRPFIDLVCVIDRSGSMAGEKLQIVKNSLSKIINMLSDNDRLCIIQFDQEAERLTSLIKMNTLNKELILTKINQIEARGYTKVDRGMELALKTIKSRRYKNSVTSIFLLSDGLDLDAVQNVGDIIKRENIQDVYNINTFGFGSDFDPIMMDSISKLGCGKFFAVENINLLEKSFTNALDSLMQTIGNKLSIQLSTKDQFNIKIQKYGDGWIELQDKSFAFLSNLLYIENSAIRFFAFQVEIQTKDELKSSNNLTLDFQLSYNLQSNNELVESQNSIKLQFDYQLETGILTNQQLEVCNIFYRIKLSEIIQQIIKQSENNDFQKAQCLIAQSIEDLQSNKILGRDQIKAINILFQQAYSYMNNKNLKLMQGRALMIKLFMIKNELIQNTL